MKKLYTEVQYREYSSLMDRMANCDDVVEGFNIHQEVDQWLTENNIMEFVQNQMDERMEKEFEDEVNEVKKEGKVIEFPKK